MLRIHMYHDKGTDSCRCGPSANHHCPAQCRRCTSGIASKCRFRCDAPGCTAEADQRRIWKQSRAASSSYVDALSAQTVVGGPVNRPRARFSMVNWNQMSDRAVPGVGAAGVPTHGSTTRTSTLRHRPGCGGRAGVGVDVKHGSYARYLARLKAPVRRTGRTSCTGTGAGPRPKAGNKRKMVGILSGVSRKTCCRTRVID